LVTPEGSSQPITIERIAPKQNTCLPSKYWRMHL